MEIKFDKEKQRAYYIENGKRIDLLSLEEQRRKDGCCESCGARSRKVTTRF